MVLKKVSSARPFVKVAGGKTQLLPALLEHVPKSFKTYHEPFIGGGALFFELASQNRISKAVLGDTNDRLIRTYTALKRDPNLVVGKLKRMKNTFEFFGNMRRKNIDPEGDAALAAWYIYLNKTCFNGLYRVNKSGFFNVPFGYYANPNICDEDNLFAVSRALKKAKLCIASFEKGFAAAKTGDFLYADPPYLPLSETSNFTSYTKEGFGWEEHVRLYECALEAKKRGVKLLLSNSGHPAIRELYEAAFTVDEVQAARNINADGKGRKRIVEFLIY